MARQENAHFYAFAQKIANEQESQVRGKQWFTADALGGRSAAPLPSYPTGVTSPKQNKSLEQIV